MVFLYLIFRYAECCSEFGYCHPKVRICLEIFKACSRISISHLSFTRVAFSLCTMIDGDVKYIEINNVDFLQESWIAGYFRDCNGQSNGQVSSSSFSWSWSLSISKHYHPHPYPYPHPHPKHPHPRHLPRPGPGGRRDPRRSLGSRLQSRPGCCWCTVSWHLAGWVVHLCSFEKMQ